MTFAGCVDDRTYFGSDKIDPSGGVVDPLGDPDDDGLTNEKEKELGTDPKDPDTDKDGLDDGLENKIIGTSPTTADTDKDGVTDGIEVLGTYPDNITEDGKVTTAGENKTPITTKDGLKVLDVDKPISVADWGNKEAANIHKNPKTDPSDKIDALDPMNDSDYDKRPNKPEIDKNTDPLDKNSFYPWIYETPKGKAMQEAGFAYIPGGFDLDNDGVVETGFWMSKYEARANQATTAQIDNLSQYVNDKFKAINASNITGYIETATTPSGEALFTAVYDNNSEAMTGMYGFEAADIVDQSQVVDGEVTKLPSNKQYAHVLKLISNYKADNVKNSIVGYDSNVEEDYERGVYEIMSNNQEFTGSLVKLNEFNENSIPAWWNVQKTFYNDGDKAAASIDALTNPDAGLGKNQDPYAVIIRGDVTTTGLVKMDLTYGVTFGEKGDIGFRAASDYLEK
jgi:predicted RNA-binding protein